jgi:dTDP-D-glucose 4,6-dehydratase
MKNLLVTGGCGFIGSNFINYYFNLSESNIINLDAMYYCASENNILPHVKLNNNYLKWDDVVGLQLFILLFFLTKSSSDLFKLSYNILAFSKLV